MFLTLGSFGWPQALDPVLLLALPAPVAIEYIAEQLGALTYSAGRQQLLTAIAAPALGTGLARHIVTPFPTWFVLMVGIHGGACVVAHMVASARREMGERAARLESEESDPILDGFTSAEEFRRYLDARNPTT
jgi:hypothetical protein